MNRPNKPAVQPAKLPHGDLTDAEIAELDDLLAAVPEPWEAVDAVMLDGYLCGVLLQPQAIRLLDLVALQLHAQLAEATRQGQLTPEQQRTNDAAIDAAVTALREHRPVDTTGLLPAIAQLFTALQGQSSRFVLSDDAIYPPATAAALRPGTRVLLTCGTNDAQVPCATTDALTTALRRAHVRGPGRVTLSGVDHLLHDDAHPNTLAPAVLDALHRFAGR